MQTKNKKGKLKSTFIFHEKTYVKSHEKHWLPTDFSDIFCEIFMRSQWDLSLSKVENV